MENQEKQTQSTQPTGWRAAMPSTRMSMESLMQFIDIINQRLCTLEDITYVKINDREQISLTELYRRRDEEAAAAQAEESKDNQEGE